VPISAGVAPESSFPSFARAAAVGDQIASGRSVGDVFMGRSMRDDWAGRALPGAALQVPPSHSERDRARVGPANRQTPHG